MVIFKNKNLYPAMPSAAMTKNGDLLVVFRNAPREKKGYTHLHSLSTILLTRSSDKGRKWSRPIELGKEDPLAKQDPHLFVTATGKILLYYFRYLFHPESELAELEKNRRLVYLHAKKKHTIASLQGLGMMVSSDNGKSFSEPRQFSLPGVVSCAVRGRAVQLGGGRILQATYARKQNGRYCIDVTASDDEGETWFILSRNIVSTRRRKGREIEFVEPSLLHTLDGNIHLFIRTHEGEEEAYTSYCVSGDSGQSFSRPKRTSIEGFPLDPLLLSDGRVLLSYGWRKKKPFGVRFRIAEPDLSDFDSAEERPLGPSSTSRDCGYPWAAQIEKNRVVIVFYNSDPGGTRTIRGEYLTI